MTLNDTLYDFYRASPMREGVLCWYPLESGASVLDLSGGVLTDLLNDRCGNVTVDKTDGGRFDYIVLLDPKDFSVEALKELYGTLNPHGRLLLAYENPFALRYWSGKASPYTGLPYDSLLGKDGRVSKAEMQIRLLQAGFQGSKWYYPLTDHWFATEIYSDSYLPDEYFNQRFFPYISDDGFLQFDERPLYREMIRGSAFAFMCGAYLVEARICEKDKPCPVDYAAVTAYRDSAKRFATTVRNDGTVWKTPLHPDGAESVLRIHRNHKELRRLGIDVIETKVENGSVVMPRLELPTLWDYWARKLSDKSFDFDEMTLHFDRIRDAIYKAGAEGTCFWELVPANCFIDAAEDRLIFFDQEYCWENTSPDIAVARAVGAMEFSSRVFKSDPRSERWCSMLLERFGLAGRKDEFFSTIIPATDLEVFGPVAAILGTESWKASSAIEQRRQPSTVVKDSERRRDRFKQIPAKLSALGFGRPIIYGNGKRGKDLKYVLYHAGIQIAATVDRESYVFSSIEQVPSGAGGDVVLVSILDGKAIVSDLRQKTDLPIYTLEELLHE